MHWHLTWGPGAGTGKTQVVVRDGHGDLKMSEVREPEKALRFIEVFNALMAGGAPDPAAADQAGRDLDAETGGRP